MKVKKKVIIIAATVLVLLIIILAIILIGFKNDSKDLKENNNKKTKETIKCKDISQKAFEITFNVFGGNEINPIKYPGDTESLPSATKDGFIFLGWYYDEGFTNKVEISNISELKTEEVKDKNNCIVGYKTLVLYAKWEEEPKPEYYCDDGFTLRGTQCIGAEVINASRVEKCPDGYHSEGKGLCIYLKDGVSIDRLHCPEGTVGPDSKGFCLTNPNDSSQEECTYHGNHWYNGVCYSNVDFPRCPDGSSPNIHGDQYGQTYFCNMFSDGTERYASGWIEYVCPDGYTLNSNSCSRTIVTDAKVR